MLKNVFSNEKKFEKFKDELKVGRSFPFAANKAVDDAWKTILIADFVSISAAVLLYILAIGPIRGFALALGLATLFDLLLSLFAVAIPNADDIEVEL